MVHCSFPQIEYSTHFRPLIPASWHQIPFSQLPMQRFCKVVPLAILSSHLFSSHEYSRSDLIMDPQYELIQFFKRLLHELRQLCELQFGDKFFSLTMVTPSILGTHLKFHLDSNDSYDNESRMDLLCRLKDRILSHSTSLSFGLLRCILASSSHLFYELGNVAIMLFLLSKSKV